MCCGACSIRRLEPCIHLCSLSAFGFPASQHSELEYRLDEFRNTLQCLVGQRGLRSLTLHKLNGRTIEMPDDAGTVAAFRALTEAGVEVFSTLHRAL